MPLTSLVKQYALYIKVAAAAVTAAGLFGAGFYASSHIAAGDIQALRAQHAEALAKIQEKRAEETQQTLTRLNNAIEKAEGVVNEARIEEARLRSARAAADAESSRLRNAAAEYQRRRAAAPCAAATSIGSETGPLPADMRDEGDKLLRVFGECVRAHAAVAADLGVARARGLTCERSYEEVARTACDASPSK